MKGLNAVNASLLGRRGAGDLAEGLVEARRGGLAALRARVSGPAAPERIIAGQLGAHLEWRCKERDCCLASVGIGESDKLEAKLCLVIWCILTSLAWHYQKTVRVTRLWRLWLLSKGNSLVSQCPRLSITFSSNQSQKEALSDYNNSLLEPRSITAKLTPFRIWREINNVHLILHVCFSSYQRSV